MNLRQMWIGSTLLRIASVLGGVTLIVLAVVLSAALFTEQSAGRGVAINLASALRMQAYLVATRVADVDLPAAERAAAIEVEVAAFDARLANSHLVAAIPAAGDEPLRIAYLHVAGRWQALRPLALAATADPAARRAFMEQVQPLVGDVEQLVTLIESDLEARIRNLRSALGAALLVILALVLAAFVVLETQVFQPIGDLARVARLVRRGDFSARTEDVGDDELGRLARDFNHMVEELGDLYGALESQIAAKTEDLARKNQSLALLYETARELAAPQLDAAVLARVAARVRDVLEVEAAVICRRHPGLDGHAPAHAADGAAELCEFVNRHGHGGADAPGVLWHDGVPGSGQRLVSIPLLDGERLCGAMPLLMTVGQMLAPWQVELAQTVGRHIGAALAAAEARDEHRRLALLEERSAIARELHDSLAQSLSYTKIQLARLSALLSAANAQTDVAQAREVVQELRDGVSAAYRQLRELLTTFRLQLSGRGLTQALAEAVADLRARLPLQVMLRDELLGVELSGNQQIHVLQIVREALANVEHHAQAQRAWLWLAPVEVAGARLLEVRIEDDGVGIDSLESPRHHFGLAIMRDRAQLLGGELQIERRAEGGTRVRLRLPIGPAGYGAGGAAGPPDESMPLPL